MTDSVRVDFDARELGRALDQLGRGINTGADRAATAQATRTASAIRADVPKRSGRLANTVQASRGDVSYGGTLPYARYIEGRSHAVANNVRNVDRTFVNECEKVADREARRI